MKLKRPLPKPAVLGGIVAAGLLVALLGWLLVISPQDKKASSLAKQTADVQKQITDNLAQIAASKNVTAAPQIKVAEVYKLAKAMPSATDMPDILIELDQVARDAGVQLQSISPSAAGPGAGGQQTVPISMSVSGDFFTVTDLLYRLRNLVSVRHGALEASGRLFAIDNVSLAPTGRSIDATITMHTFVYSAAAAAAAAPVAAAPATTTSTDSTTTTPSPDTPPSSPSAAGAP